MAEVPGGGSDPLARALRDEWGALGLMSYHGVGTALKGEKMWRADLDPDDVGKIRALLKLAASELAGLRERLAETEAERDAAVREEIRRGAEALASAVEKLEALRVERDTAVDALREILRAWGLGSVDQMHVLMLGAFLRQFGKAPDLAEAGVPTFAPDWEFGRCITCTSPMTSEESIASDCCTACLTGPAELRIGRDTDDPYGG